MKHCPKCGSAYVNFLAFYRPQIWKCLDCGYEDAFIIEDGGLAEKMQERCQKGCDVFDRTERETRKDYWDSLIDDPRDLKKHT